MEPSSASPPKAYDSHSPPVEVLITAEYIMPEATDILPTNSVVVLTASWLVSFLFETLFESKYLSQNMAGLSLWETVTNIESCV